LQGGVDDAADRGDVRAVVLLRGVLVGNAVVAQQVRE
jgi:hypothetical protein